MSDSQDVKRLIEEARKLAERLEGWKVVVPVDGPPAPIEDAYALLSSLASALEEEKGHGAFLVAQLAEARRERDEARGDLVCHCGSLLYDHGLWSGHPFTPMQLPCPAEKELTTLRASLARHVAELESARTERDRLHALKCAIGLALGEGPDQEAPFTERITTLKAELDRLRAERDEAQSILASTADRLNVALREAGCPEISDDIYRSFSIRSGIVDLYDKGARLRAENEELRDALSKERLESGEAEAYALVLAHEGRIESMRHTSADAARELEEIAGEFTEDDTHWTAPRAADRFGHADRLRSIAAHLRGESSDE